MNESRLKEETEKIKEIFNFNGDETQLQHIKEVFIYIIQNDFKSRPKYQNISRELVNCLCSCFPKKIKYIHDSISWKPILKFIIFPEQYPINEGEMRLLLKNDDIDGFISFLSNNPTIDIQDLQNDDYYEAICEYSSIAPIDYCCLFGSLKCFKYLLLNNCETSDVTVDFSVQGGNQEIIAILL